MRNDSNPHGFTIPESFLNQLGEYTRGYLLLVCNEKGELFSHEAYDNPVIKLGLIKFGDLHIGATLSNLQDIALREEQIFNEEEPIDEDEDNRDLD